MKTSHDLFSKQAILLCTEAVNYELLSHENGDEDFNQIEIGVSKFPTISNIFGKNNFRILATLPRNCHVYFFLKKSFFLTRKFRPFSNPGPD